MADTGKKVSIQIESASREDLIAFLKKQATLIKKLQAKAASAGGTSDGRERGRE